jgi:hypothetical protein
VYADLAIGMTKRWYTTTFGNSHSALICSARKPAQVVLNSLPGSDGDVPRVVLRTGSVVMIEGSFLRYGQAVGFIA